MPCTVVDLFCGIGGLTKGLELANLNVAAGIDIDESCRFAYEANNNSQFICTDISAIPAEDIENLYPQGHIRALVGCAPCQPFSKYTKRYRKEGHVDDKWKLLYAFSRLVSETRPQIISMENVPELAKEIVFKDFLTSLQDMGYNCDWKIVFCPDYGVPQKRKRLVLLASLLGDIHLIQPLHTVGNYVTVRNAIENLPPLNDGESDNIDLLHRATKLSTANQLRIRQSVPGGTWKDWDDSLKLKCHKKESGKGYGAVYGRMLWDEPSPTITTQFYGYGNGRFGHPEQHRALSYREGAILQSFPNDYIFVNGEHSFNRRELGVHIGNAVPVQLGRAIGMSINEHLVLMGVNDNGN